jgi:hypothetical protein
MSTMSSKLLTLIGYSSSDSNVYVFLFLLGLEARLALDVEDSVVGLLWRFGTCPKFTKGPRGGWVRDGLLKSRFVRIATGVSFSSACPSLADEPVGPERFGVAGGADFFRGGMRLVRDARLRNEGDGTRLFFFGEQNRESAGRGCGVGKLLAHAKTKHCRQLSWSQNKDGVLFGSSVPPPRGRYGAGATLGEAIAN